MGNHFAAEVRLEHEVYYPGNVVRGEATIKVDKPLKCIAARIMCRGFERAVVVNHSNEMIYNVFEDTVFYKETLTLFGHSMRDAATDPVEIPPGVYTYPFAFELPMHLPESTHTSDWASGGVDIRYQVITYAKIDKDRIEEGHHDFTVVVPINKRDMLASAPIEESATAELRHLFKDKGVCEFALSLPRRIYAADDVVEADIAIDNTLGLMDVEQMRVSLKLHCDVALSERASGIACGQHESWRAGALVVKRVAAMVPQGKTKMIALRFTLPHTVPTPSYPDRGACVRLAHILTVEIAGAKLKVPIHIAHCADDENRFEFCPLGVIAHKPDNQDMEYAYIAPPGYAASPCEGLHPPDSLPKQPPPTPQTPQAVGTGQLHAR